MIGFLDTNILVHSLQRASPFAAIAEGLLSPANRVGVQSLNELAVVCRRKLLMSWREVRQTIDAIRGLVVEPPIPLTLDIHMQGLRIADRHQLHLYDSLLMAAALHAGCVTFWSEDLHAGLVVDGALTVRNPFA